MNRPSMYDILNESCRTFGTLFHPARRITSRSYKYVATRDVACAIAHRLGYSYPEIAAWFRESTVGARGHSTFIESAARGEARRSDQIAIIMARKAWGVLKQQPDELRGLQAFKFYCMEVGENREAKDGNCMAG